MKFLKNCARESHKVCTICEKPKHCKARFVFPTKARNAEILSGGFTQSLLILVDIEYIDYS